MFSLCGCSRNSKDSSSDLKNMSSSLNVVSDSLTTNTLSSSYLDSSLATNSIIYESTVSSESEFYSEKDLIVLNQFNNLSSDIFNEENEESFLDKGKKYFIYSVDFLFYDGDIHGIKFSDLTNSAKEQLLSDISTVDSLICSRFPNYKDSISNGAGALFNNVMEIIRNGVRNVNDFSRDKLSEENYNKIGKYKDLFIETAFSDWDKFAGILEGGKQKVKNLYEEFRKDNQCTTDGHK